MFKNLLDKIKNISPRNAAIVFIVAIAATIALAAGYERIAKDKLVLGTGTSTNKTVEFDIGLSPNPMIRANSSTSQLEFANDGTNFLPLGSGSGGAGGTNVLQNQGWEAGTGYWTNVGATYSVTSTAANVGAGLKAAAWDPSSLAQTLTSDQYTVPSGLYGRECEGSIWYKGSGDATLKVIDGTPSTLASVKFPQVASTYTRVRVRFTCPTSGTFALQLYADGNADAGYFDEAFLGEKYEEKELRNYAKDQFFMQGGLDYLLYNDSAAAPVDGTGGVVSNLTRVIDNNSPLRYLRHLTLTKDAANDQGEGMAYAFTLDRTDYYPNPKMIKVSFDYETSANFDCGDPMNPTDPSDITMWVYDVSGAQVMQLSPWVLDCSGKFQGYFQANYNDSSYRLIFHITTTNALAWTFKITNIKIGPDFPQAFAPPVKDYISFTPVLNSNTNVTENVGYWARVGDTLFMHGHIKYGGVGDASTIYVSLPTGMTMDTTKFSTDTGENNLGHGMWRDSGVAVYTLIALYNANNQIYFNQTSTGPALQSNGMTSGDSVTYQLIIPITGWSANTPLNTGGAHNEVEVIAYLTASQSVPTATSKVLGESSNLTKYKDNRGAMSTSGVFTAPFSGYYIAMLTLSMEIQTAFTGTDSEHWKAWSQDSDGNQLYFFDYPPRSLSMTEVFSGTNMHYLKAGDTLSFYVYQNSGNSLYAIGGGLAYTRMSIVKYSGAATVQMGEGLTFFAHKTGGNQSVTSGSDDKISYQTEDWDDFGQYDSVTNNRFNVQNPGKYRCTQCFKTTYGAGVTVSAPHFLKNGTNTVGYFYKYVTAGNQDAFCNSLPMKLLAGDYIESYYYSGGGTTTVESHATNRATTFSCERIGN